MAYQSNGAEVQLAEVVTPPPPAEMRASLPKTGSELPLIALCGLLALGAAFTLRSVVTVKA
jgi:LPXTG-motif cell wall-anchored protein